MKISVISLAALAALVSNADAFHSPAFSPRVTSAISTSTSLKAAVTAALIKELRERTGAGMMDCKKALTENGGDIEASIEAMRTSGQVKAAKKATKVAAEGQIFMRTSEDGAAMVEVNCQTDFVAKDASFQAFANKVADAAMADKPSIEDLKATFEDDRVDLVAKIGENIQINRVTYVEGNTMSYLHNGSRIGVVVAGEGENEVLKQICMHVCASNPQFLDVSAVPEEVIENEKKVQIEIAMNEGKPADIAEKMVGGRMKKFAAEISLLAQPFVIDPKKSVSEILKEKNTSVAQFVRMEVGETAAKQEGPSFADEVAAMAGGN